MKVKNVQIKAKPQQKGVQQQIINKAKGPVKPVVKKVVPQITEKLTLSPKKQPQKKALKKQLPVVKIAPQSEEDDEEDDELNMKGDAESNDSVYTDSSNEDLSVATESNVSAGDAVDDDSEDDAEGDDSEDDAASDDSDDEEPIEAPIIKKGSSVGEDTLRQINTGDIPKDMPDEQVLVVTNLPPKFKQIDIVEVFAKYGKLHTIHHNLKPTGNSAFVAFTTADSAKMALAANQKATVRGQTIKVALRTPNLKKEKASAEKKKKYEEQKQLIEQSEDRTMLVRNLKQNVTEELIREHFETCGTVEIIKIVPRQPCNIAFVTFADSTSVEPAKKLNNSILGGGTIFVKSKTEEWIKTERNPALTICLKNKQNLEALSGDTVSKIFSKCGEIENFDILCRKSALAFVSFKKESAVKKAMELSGTTVAGVELDIESFKQNLWPKTTIFVYNVKPGVKEEAVRDLFAESGKITSIVIKKGFAIVRFETVEGFCKSFLQNEALLAGQMIFLEPYSEKKQQFLKRSTSGQEHDKKKSPGKRPFTKFANGNAKRPKFQK